MSVSAPHPVDVVIFGGGAAGLWLLDVLRRGGRSVILIEANGLGAGQTIGCQGIIHGGLKYTLRGIFTPSAKAIREMPPLWARCLAGERQPDLSAARLRQGFCHLWRTGSITSRLGMIGARAGLRVRPSRVDHADLPAVLASAQDVFRVDEQVIDPASFLDALYQPHRDCVLKVGGQKAVDFSLHGSGRVDSLCLHDRDTGDQLALRPGHVVLTAGRGNRELRRAVGLPAETMQVRPLHLVLARGKLPVLNGHCVDGAKTRVTVTTAEPLPTVDEAADPSEDTIWQIGGQVSEDGVAMEPAELIEHAQRELLACLPGLDVRDVEWATYRVDRAEPAMPGGLRPESAFAQLEGNTITAWPTKLALAPLLAQQIVELLGEQRAEPQPEDHTLDNWPRPTVAAAPWQEAQQWIRSR